MAELIADSLQLEILIALCNSIREGAAIFEADSKKISYCNHSFLQLFGFASMEEVTIETFRTKRKEKLPQSELIKREAIIRKDTHFTELTEFSVNDNHSFFGEVTVNYHSSDKGGYFLYIVNPVEKSFFEMASLGILMVNKKGEIVTANPFVVNQFGYSKNELTGKKIEILVPARFRDNHISYRENFTENAGILQTRVKMELTAVRKDGTEFPVEVSLDQYPSHGELYIIAFINNISSQKEAELEARKLREELESKVEQRTRDLKTTLKQLEISKVALQKVNLFQKALLDNAGALIIATDETGMINLFNPEAASCLGYHESEIINLQSPILFHDKYEIAQKRNKLFDEYEINVVDDFSVLIEYARKNNHEEDQYTYIRKNGTTFPVLLTITSIRDSNGAISGYLGIAIDITERKKKEEDLRIALEKEKELNELKSRFVTMASHEFRTPLSTILSSTFLIEKYSSTDEQPKRQAHLKRILSSVSMLTDILNDFLSVGKIEEGKIQVRLTQFNLKEEILGIILELENTLKKKQTIQYQHEGDPEILLDANLLKHIIMNLLSNASKFSSEGSSIEISSIRKGSQLIISVKDYGMGISRDDQKHLLERFFRGANAANIQGTGLGLHIVSKYTELLNGKILWKSELEKGTEFIIKIQLNETAIGSPSQ